MAAIAAFTTDVYVETSDAYSHLLGECVAVKFDANREMLDDTEFNDTAPSHVAGLKVASISVDYNLNTSDTSQGYLRSANEAGTAVWIKVMLYSTTFGYKCQCLVSSISHSVDVKGVVKCTATLTPIAAWASVTSV